MTIPNIATLDPGTFGFIREIRIREPKSFTKGNGDSQGEPFGVRDDVFSDPK